MSDHLLHLTDRDMSREELAKRGTVLVDFWASWCGPCRMIGPAVEKLADEFAGRAQVGKLNVDENADSAMEYNVASIPTLVVFKDGVEVERVVGVQPPKALSAMLELHL